MSDSTKVTLTFTNEALEVLNTLATERKRGMFLSKLILATRNIDDKGSDDVLERIEERLARIENQAILVTVGGKKDAS